MKRIRAHIPGWSWLRWSQWIGVLLALLVFGGGGISSWSCPHGNHFRVSFVGISRSNMGGPCRNEALIVRSWRIGGEWYVWVAE